MSTPKYVIVEDWIKDQIYRNHFKNGDKIPSENALMRQFGFSRQTIRSAISNLEKLHLLKSVKGSGTYVDHLNVPPERKIRNFGVIINNFNNQGQIEMIKGIEETFGSNNSNVSLAVTHNRLDKEAVILHSMMDGKLDGVIVEGTRSAFINPNYELYKKIREHSVCVFIKSKPPGFVSPIVSVDALRAGYMSTKYLFECGHKNIAYIFRYDDMLIQQYWVGAISAHKEYNLNIAENRVIWYHYEELENIFDYVLERVFFKYMTACTVIVCQNSWVVKKLIDFLHKIGVKPFDDVSIMCLEDDQYCIDNNITSLEYAGYEIGIRAAELCLKMKKGIEGKDILLPSNIIVRDSVHTNGSNEENNAI